MDTIIRVEKNKDFTVISNVHLRDERLSWAAKGLLTYLLYLPDDWKIYLSELINHTSSGYTKTNTTIKELILSGYIQRTKIRSEKGKFLGYEYLVTEIPNTSDFNRKRKTINGKTVNGKTINGKSSTTKYLSKLNTNKLNTKTTTEPKIKENIVNEIDEKDVVVVSDDEVNLLKKEIDNNIGKIETNKLLNLIKKHGIGICKTYLKNFNKFGGTRNPVGFYIKAIEEMYSIPENKAVKYKNKLPQEMNFEQRKVDDDFDWDSLYDN